MKANESEAHGGRSPTAKAAVSGAVRPALTAVAALGGAALIAGLLSGDARLWPGLLLNGFYFLTLALGAMVFVAVQHISSAGWSAVIRRIPEAMMSYLPIGAAAMLVLFFGRESVYPWVGVGAGHVGRAHAGEATGLRAWALSTPSFYARMAIVLGLWIVFMRLLRRESRLQDEDGSIEHTARSRKISASFLVVFGITFSLASFDWIMSLEPRFYSTVFAVYCFSGLFLSGMAAIALFAVFLRRRGVLSGLNEAHLHTLGKLIFGFTTFWAYIWLSQYLLIYYANLPEETIHYMRQTATPGWHALFLLNLFMNWVIPFVILLPRDAKRSGRWLVVACVFILAGHWIDLYLMTFAQIEAAAAITPLDVLLTAGFASLFVLVVLRALALAPLLPARDPYLAESLSLRPEP